MATLLDAVGALKELGVYQTIFPFILVTAGVYAVLTKFKPFGDMKFINGVVATVTGLLFITMARAVTFLNLLMPIITVFLLLVVLALVIFTFMGIKGETITEVLTKETAAWGLLLMTFIIIILVVLTQVFPEASVMMQNPIAAQEMNLSLAGPGATPQQQAAALMFMQVMQVLFAPQVLGLIIMMLVFAVATYFITREPVK